MKMRPTQRPTARINLWLTHLATGLLALVSIAPTMAETKTKKQSTTAETPPPKKKARPPATPAATTEKSDAVKSGASSEAKSKRVRATPPPAAKPNPPDQEPTVAPPAKAATAANAAITPEEILEFHAQPEGVRKLIESSLDLVRRNLTYTFGSADPANGGMDCSGFIYYTLRQHGLTQVPRDSSGLYIWARKAQGFRAVVSRKPDSFEMDELLPGDLLFWIGTYATEKDPPVSHTMIYLGTEKATGAKIMIGSSDGRTYRGQKRNGVSVFDFTMPRTPVAGEQRSTFIGYARIPGLRN